MAAPQDPHLYEHLHAFVKASFAAAASYRKEGHELPATLSTHTVIEQLHPDGSVAAVSQPVRAAADYQSLIRHTLRARFTALPEFAALCRYVESSHVAGHLLVDGGGTAIQGEEGRRRWLYGQFLAPILARCLETGAMGGIVEGVFPPLYSELEQYMQATEFEVVFWAPLADFDAGVSPVSVDSDLVVRQLADPERTQVWDLGQSGTIDPSHASRMRFALETRYCIGKYASADASQANERFRLAVTAMRLMKPATPAVYVTIHRSARPRLFGAVSGWGARHAPRPAHSRVFYLEEEDVQPLRELHQSLCGLRHSGSLKLAQDRFERAIERDNVEDRLIDLWVGLEGLFLKRDEQLELSYRAALRIARFVGEKADRRAKIFKTMKESYGARSRVVHGDPPPRDIVQITASTEDVLREALRSSVLSGSGPDLDKLDRDAVRAASRSKR